MGQRCGVTFQSIEGSWEALLVVLIVRVMLLKKIVVARKRARHGSEVAMDGAKHQSLLQSFEKECERDRVAYSNALRAHSADNKEEGGTKECL